MTPPTSSRYETLVKIASGGMATVYVGRVRGALGFEQLVAIKRPHPHLVENPVFRQMLAGEARLAARIRHANAVAIRDAELVEDNVLLVMDYIEGGSLSELPISAADVPDRRSIAPVLVRIILDVCAGLHAAHELRDDDEVPLGLVHRDVSPHNVLLGLDGLSRVTDFGIAKCFDLTGDATTEGVVKGKVAYMSPEQIEGKPLDRRSDVFALGVVLWEVLSGQRLFRGDSPVVTIARVLHAPIPPISVAAPGIGTAFDAIVERALCRAPNGRYSSLAELAEALESAAQRAGLLAGHPAVARLVSQTLGPSLAARRERIRALRGGRSAEAGPSHDVTGSLSLPVPRQPPLILATPELSAIVPLAPEIAPAAPLDLRVTTPATPSTIAATNPLPRAPAETTQLTAHSAHSFTPASTDLDDALSLAGRPSLRPPTWALTLSVAAIVVLGGMLFVHFRSPTAHEARDAVPPTPRTDTSPPRGEPTALPSAASVTSEPSAMTAASASVLPTAVVGATPAKAPRRVAAPRKGVAANAPSPGPTVAPLSEPSREPADPSVAPPNPYRHNTR